jgi:hypothetical protein
MGRAGLPVFESRDPEADLDTPRFSDIGDPYRCAGCGRLVQRAVPRGHRILAIYDVEATVLYDDRTRKHDCPTPVRYAPPEPTPSTSATRPAPRQSVPTAKPTTEPYANGVAALPQKRAWVLDV